MDYVEPNIWTRMPLALSISLDFYLVGRIIVGNKLISLLAALVLAWYLTLWFVLPRSRGLQERIAGSTASYSARTKQNED